MTLDTHLNKFNASLTNITKSVATIQKSIKDDLELTKKILQASETCQQNLTQFTELVTMLKSSNIQGLSSSVDSIKSSLILLEKHMADWAKSSNSMAWKLGPRMTALETSQASLEAKVTTL